MFIIVPWHIVDDAGPPAGPSLVLYEAIADYEGKRDKNQTTLIVGSRVKVLDKKEHGEGGKERRKKGGKERRKEGRKKK